MPSIRALSGLTVLAVCLAGCGSVTGSPSATATPQFIEPEVTAKVARLRPAVRIYEVGVAYHGRSYEEGKKITWKDGIKAILTIVRFRFFD